MLDKIKFTGYTVKSSSFKLNKDSVEGKFDVKFDQVVINSDEPIDGEKPGMVTMTSKPKLVGYAVVAGQKDKYEDEPSFEAEVELNLTFENLNDFEIDEDIYEANSWFFENFLAIAIKLSLESVLKNTMFDKIPLPWARPDIEFFIEKSDSE